MPTVSVSAERRERSRGSDVRRTGVARIAAGAAVNAAHAAAVAHGAGSPSRKRGEGERIFKLFH